MRYKLKPVPGFLIYLIIGSFLILGMAHQFIFTGQVYFLIFMIHIYGFLFVFLDTSREDDDYTLQPLVIEPEYIDKTIN